MARTTESAIEEWLVERGVPHLVEPREGSSIRGVFGRALPLLVAAYVLLGLNALDLRHWSLARNLTAAAGVVAILIAAWVVSNRLRGATAFASPTRIDARELVLFLIGPMLPSLAFGQVGDAAQTLAMALVLLAAIYVWSSYGVGALVRWGVRRGSGQLSALGPLVAKALPLLLLFNTFLFVNAEVWEVAGTLSGAPYVIVVLTFFVLGATFVLTRVPSYIRAENAFADWDEVAATLPGTPAAAVGLPVSGDPTTPLRLRQRVNVGLIVVFGQAIQITLVAVALVAFFVLFGFLAITEETVAAWTGIPDVHTFAHATLGGRSLVLSEPLLRVSVFLGTFSGMYFTVVLSTDETYRVEFADDVGPEIHQILGVRAAYRAHLDGTAGAGDDPSPR